MKLVKAAEMRELDQEAIQRFQIPGMILMENAGLSIVNAILDRRWDHDPVGKSVLIIAGPGNNGGDGLVVGRHLLNKGSRVEIFLTAPPESYQGDAAANLKIVQAMGIPCRVYDSGDIHVLQEAIRSAELIVDALFGTGFRGVPGEPLATLITMVNTAQKPVLAVDLPSGMEADTGRVAGACIRAQLTVTMGLPKIGLYLEPGAGYAGEVVVGDISFPPELRSPDGSKYALLEAETVAGILPPRLAVHHKGDYGHVLVIGGTRGYTGAAVLAANAALRGGAGLVTAAVPASLYPIAAVKLTEAMTYPVHDTKRGGFDRTALESLRRLLERATVLAVGPGFGQDPETGIFLRELLTRVDLPVVIDADALNFLAKDKEILSDPRLRERRKRWVLTPHPGEMARLLGSTISAVQEDRIGNAGRSGREWGATVVLKGARTVIAGPEGCTLINATGNPGLATGGTGDVLTGLIAGLLAQGIPSIEAAGAGVFIHGCAADRIAARKGMAGLIAGDLLEEIPLVLQKLYQISGNGGTNQ